MNDDMFCCPGWDTALVRRIEQMPTDLFMLSARWSSRSTRATRASWSVISAATPNISTRRASSRRLRKLVRADWLGLDRPPTLVHRDWWNRIGGYSSELSPGMSSDNDSR